MKKNVLATIAACAALALCLVACAPKADPTPQPSGDPAPMEYAAGSVYGYHTDVLKLDFSAVTEVSYASCIESGCHSWDKVVASTEGMFPGLGQITDANPHAAHATNAYLCSDCHSLNGVSILTCDSCHIFTAPEGWDEPSKMYTNFGLTATESMF